MSVRREFLIQAGRLATAAGFSSVLSVQAAAPVRTTLAVPGPGNLLFLPLTLAPKIGADVAEGVEFDLRYVGGGPQAYREMLERNVDFSAGGFAALVLQHLSGKPVLSIAPLTRVPAYTLLVRKELKGRVRKLSDLAGRVVGVKGHTPGGRSTSQLFTEYVMSEAGVGMDRVNYVSVGQSYESQHAALATGTVDAMMGDEPFATRLVAQKVAFALADYHDLKDTQRRLGGLFLNGQLATREDVVATRPELAERVVRAVSRTLVWIATHSAPQMVEALAIADPAERSALMDVLKLRKTIYVPDGRFSDQQIATVERFVRATENTPAAQALNVASLVHSRWAGRSA